jgi:uncharacterized protein (TIGR03118 family)
MKRIKLSYRVSRWSGAFIFMIASAVVFSGCKKKNDMTRYNVSEPSATVVYLVADDGSYGAANLDPALQNAWGMAINPTGRLWVSSTGKGVTTIYDGTGKTLRAPVEIMSNQRGTIGQPTGVVYNSTTDFTMPGSGAPVKFIYVGLDGSIAAWSSGDTANVVGSRPGASYTGLALANDGSGNFLYAANYGQGTVDVYDTRYELIPGKTLIDPSMPQGYAPYNIQLIAGKLYVTYAPMASGSGSMSGVNGFVDIFDPNGTFIKRFTTGGTLNYPWGIATIPVDWDLGSDLFLIGNFGDGTLSIFDGNGNYRNQMQMNGSRLSIDGLWALVNPPSSASSLDPDAIYFSAGPKSQTRGVVGYIKIIVSQ